ncbi:YcbK family protein [Almyronema epifaneia]|uniref:Murein endopeptidase K n=1 Tax=Almyronema epifaneia S1 TaxID=2991925 RepID=A0ABW6IBY0_9CYAN
MAEQFLRVIEDTVFKLRPEQTAQLSEQEQYAVAAGSTFEIQSYAYADATGDFNGHVRFALANTAIQGFNTWYAYSLHIQIDFDGQVVYPNEDQTAIPILRITRSTLLKRRPLDAAMLPEDEKAAAAPNQSYALLAYAYADTQGDFSSHIKFTFRYQQDYIRGLNTWFVYEKHAYVEFDRQVVYPPEDPNAPVLRITANTLLKRRPLQSTALSSEETYSIPAGTVLKLHSYAYADANGDFNNHIKFALRYEQDYIKQLSTWYVYEGHAQVERNGKVVYPLPQPTTPSTPIYTGRSFKLPGNISTFYSDQPIIPGGSFTWGEATKDGTRIPPTENIVNNIIGLARQLQRAREQIGQPFQVNSWYRPPAVNRAVGGASQSYHLTGKAADLQVEGYSGRRLANVVMSWWPGGIGIYSTIPNLLHLDTGPRRFWGF